MTDQERLEAALTRAAERIATMRKMYDAKYSSRIEQIEWLAGWAEAVEALERGLGPYWQEHELERPHLGDCDTCPKLEVIAKFCNAMLGKVRKPQTIEEIATTVL